MKQVNHLKDLKLGKESKKNIKNNSKDKKEIKIEDKAIKQGYEQNQEVIKRTYVIERVFLSHH